MKAFLSLHTDSSIYQSEFFHKSSSGKETTAWASLISRLNNNPRIQVFFFDMNDDEGKLYQRDSIMSEKIKTQFLKHPRWKMIALSGNYHNRTSGEPTMAAYLLKDPMFNVCSLNME